MSDDDLGNFFAEISTIEVPTQDEPIQSEQPPQLTVPILMVPTSSSVERPATQVISKPPEKIVKSETHVSHPVYTYDFGENNMLPMNDDAMPPSAPTSSSSQFSFSSTTTTARVNQPVRQNKTFVRTAACKCKILLF